MNLVGKIITVVLFVMSLFFLGLAVMVYATGENYKQRVAGSDGEPALDSVLRNERQTLESRQAEQKQLQLRLSHERGTRLAALAALERKSQEMRAAIATQQQEFETLLQQHQDNIATIGTAEEKIASLKIKVDQARAKLASDFKQRDAILKAIVQTTDLLNQGEGQLRRLKERNDQLRSNN